MANLGGGAEAHARFEYRANSSLVLTTDSRPRDTHEPTGEPESLYGKIDPKSFGDRAYRGRPADLDEKLTKRRRLQEESVLTNTEEGVYQPKTKETRAAYEAMLSVIQQQLGGQPLNIVSGAAGEILAVLKNDVLKNVYKVKDIEKLLNPIPGQLVSIGRLITDFQDAGGDGNGVNGDDALDDDVGVAVEYIPSEIIIEILSRLPVKSLARFRCVSKQWCEYIDDKSLKIYQPLIMTIQIRAMIRNLYAIESSTDQDLKAPKIRSMDFRCESDHPIFLGFCNALVYLTLEHTVHPDYFLVVDPLREEYYSLPPMDQQFRCRQYHFGSHPPCSYEFSDLHSGLHGLGFDDVTNTYKMVFFAHKQSKPCNLLPMLHVFGTDSWRQISFQLPKNLILAKKDYQTGAIYSGGCLHWPACNSWKFNDESKIICLDLRTEVFRLINLPKKQGPGEITYGELVNIHGDVGCVYVNDKRYNFIQQVVFEVWVLKQKEWVIHCRFGHNFSLPLVGYLRPGNIKVFGGWNKDGDIFIKNTTEDFFMYCQKSGLIKEVRYAKKSIKSDICYSFIYPSSLYSIHGIKAYSIQK